MFVMRKKVAGFANFVQCYQKEFIHLCKKILVYDIGVNLT